MRTPERSRELFESGWCCSESAVQAIAEHYGIESDLVPAVATGLCGGMAYMGGPCGALTGAILGVGLVAGRRSPTGDKTRPYAIVQALVAQFEERFGATGCIALTGVDLGTPEGHAAYHANGQKARCMDYVAEATRLALALLDEGGRVGPGDAMNQTLQQVLPVAISIAVIILIAVAQAYSKTIAAITATMPLTIPLALWIVYAAGGEDRQQAIADFTGSLFVGVAATLVFTLALWLAARAGLGLVAMLSVAYGAWVAVLLASWAVRTAL